MATLIRRSPVSFAASPARTEARDGWRIALEYEGEADGPYLVDLSHCPRWDVQDAGIDAAALAGLSIPEVIGSSRLRDGVLVNRMGRAQVSVWHLRGRPVELPAGPQFTDVTEATVFLGLLGRGVLEIAEKLSNLDLADPSRTPPFLIQGPLSHVACQIVVMGLSGSAAGLLFTCSRGYARDMARAVLQAGDAHGLQPAGEDTFHAWLEALRGQGAL